MWGKGVPLLLGEGLAPLLSKKNKFLNFTLKTIFVRVYKLMNTVRHVIFPCLLCHTSTPVVSVVFPPKSRQFPLDVAL